MSKKIFLLRTKILSNTFLFVISQVVTTLIFINTAFGQKEQVPGYAGNLIRSTLLRFSRAGDSIPINIVKKDSANNTRSFIKGFVLLTGSNIYFSLQDSMVLNYKKWNFSPGNRIGFTARGILAEDFLLSNDSSVISLTSRQNLANGPIDIVIRNLDVKDLSGLFNLDSFALSGLLSATIQASEFSGGFPTIAGTASISNIELAQQPIGNLQVTVQGVDKKTIHTTLDLTGNGNLLSGSGNFFLNNRAQQFDLSLDIKKLQMAALQGLVKNMISKIIGSLTGLVVMKGNLKKPQWNGELTSDSTQFSIGPSGTNYSINQQKILFDYPAIHLNSFTIKDSLDHAFILNGNVYSNNSKAFGLDLDIKSTDFTLINASQAINNQLYGYAGIKSMVSIKGTTADPVISGDVMFNDKTDITMVLPLKNTDKDAAGAVVRFIDRDTFTLPELGTFKSVTEPRINFAKYVNRNLNFRLDNQATLTVILDPATGDELKVKGDAKLNGGIDSVGDMIMSGTYVLNSGYYELNYQFLKKRFILIPGSTIVFGGDPLDAKVNIRAEYIANTAPKDLLGNEVGAVDAATANSFKQNIPFRVILFLKGSLNNPQISFDIQLPETAPISSRLRTTIENKLTQLRADIAPINKQVFALLVLERFVGEQSTDFFKGNGGDFSGINKESVSKFLSAA
ncbi:MAG: translocation/assembly module TamB domain-containing protein, partial [Ferruginibacter sp.]